VSEELVKLAIQVQSIPSPGLSSVENILSGTIAGTFSQSTPALTFSIHAAGDFFERLGRPVRYEVSDLPTTCCLTTYSVGFPTPAATDRANGDGTVVVLVYKLRQAGIVDLDPGLGLIGNLFVTTYTAQLRISGG